MQTVQTRFEDLSEVNKSKFVAIIIPLNNADDFKKLLADIKKEHAKAKHIVYAYRVKEKSKSCDDQEPKGTAGKPLLELLHKREMDQVVIFVARYFGGTKLGASRLLRTYLQAGINVLNKAQLVQI
ncbi:MAG TPA: YigZ family protein [Bacilli bacterium]|nr:YigZ family protein [Bacilli bacterium]HPS18637.1 YigZ family protein [Bacilli bacterium]